MSYTPTEKDYKLLQQRNKASVMKLVFLNKNTMLPYGDLSGNIIDYECTVEASSTYRRIFRADLIINNRDIALFHKDTVILNWIVQPYVGYVNMQNDETAWYLLGTFAFCEKSYKYDKDSNTLSINCNDLMSYLDGTLGGNIMGVNNVTIQSYRDGLYYGLAKSIYLQDASEPYGLYISSNTKIIMSLPYDIYDTAYLKEDTFHICGHTNKKNIGDSGGRIDIKINNRDELKDSDVFDVYDMDMNKSQGLPSSIDNIYSYVLDDTTGNAFKITALQSVNISCIEVYDYFVSREYPVAVWNFGKSYTTHDGYSSVYPVAQQYQIQNIAISNTDGVQGVLTDLSLKDERFTIYGKDVSIEHIARRYAVRGYDYDYTNDHNKYYYIAQCMVMTIDTTEGDQVSLKEVIKALLEQAGITRYRIDDIYEVVPYDQTLSSNLTYYNILEQLISLYSDIEMFFDTDGVLVFRHIPTVDEDSISLSNQVLQPLVIDEEYKEDLTTFYNVTEVWGNNIEADYFIANSDDNICVNFDESDNMLVLYCDNLPVSDEGKIVNGTVLAVSMPDNISGHSAGIKASVNNTNDMPIDIQSEKINLSIVWQSDQQLSDKIRDNFPSSVNSLPCNDIVIYGRLYEEHIENNESKKIYIIDRGLHSLPKQDCIVNGIDFSEKFMQNSERFFAVITIKLRRPNYIYDYTENVKRLDVDKLANCIRFKAKAGEVIRFYFIQSELSVADEYGNILTQQVSSINVDNYIWYMDFYARNKEEAFFYVFDGITDSVSYQDDYTCVEMLGMSKFTYKAPSIPIKDTYTDQVLDSGFLEANTSYCFQFSQNTLWYLGQWQIHAVAIEMKDIPSDFDEYYKKYNTKNLIITQYSPPNAIDVVGEKNQVLSGGDYENIYSDGLALERADWENWKATHIGKSLSLTSISIPWLECNTKITYQSNGDKIKPYIINSINYNSSGTMSLGITPFYPRYKNASGLNVKNIISTDGMVNALPSDNTMFSNSLWNYNLFDYKYYANKYSDIKNAYGYNAKQLWNHWCLHGIAEGRQCSIVYNALIYSNYAAFLSEQTTYINKIKSAFGYNYTNDNGYKNMAMYLHFLDKGINDYNVVCSNEFNIKIYAAYEDLKEKYDDEWRKYYEHCVKYNYVENRVCI